MNSQNPQDQQLKSLYQQRKQQQIMADDHKSQLRQQIKQAHQHDSRGKFSFNQISHWGGGAIAACLVIAVLLNFMPTLEHHPQFDPAPQNEVVQFELADDLTEDMADEKIETERFVAEPRVAKANAPIPEQLLATKPTTAQIQAQGQAVKSMRQLKAKKAAVRPATLVHQLVQVISVSKTQQTMTVRNCQNQKIEIKHHWTQQAKPQQWIKIYYQQNSIAIYKIESMEPMEPKCVD
jgi:hypothetical protein